MKESEKLLNDFEKKFGFNVWYELKTKLLNRLYSKIVELTKSRDMWKEKYLELKTKQKDL